MKMQSNNFPAQLSSRETNSQVMQILASDVDMTISKNSFTPADLWNIQRMKRVRVSRRFIM